MTSNQTSYFNLFDILDDGDNGEEFYFNSKLNNINNTLQGIDDEEFIDLITTTKTMPKLNDKNNKIVQKISTNNMKQDMMPKYILSKKKLFDSIFQSNTNELRQMAFYLSQISYFKYLYDLWSKYLQAGLDKLKRTEQDEQQNRRH